MPIKIEHLTHTYMPGSPFASVAIHDVNLEIEDGELMLHNVFAPAGVTLEGVIASFGAQVRRVTLGFAPQSPAGFDCAPYHEQDCTLFVRGAAFEDFARRRLRIPSLSHA